MFTDWITLFFVNLTIVTQLSFGIHRHLWYECVSNMPLIHNSQTTLGGFLQRRPPFHDFKITLECLDLELLMTSMQELQIYWFRLYIDWFLVITLKGEGTESFWSQISSSKVFFKCVLWFSLFLLFCLYFVTENVFPQTGLEKSLFT